VPGASPWWTAVIITASSQRQAERYRWELHRREERGRIPSCARYLVVPDIRDQRIGSGGATINAIRALAAETLSQGSGEQRPRDLVHWWAAQRVLMIHSGGDSRRLPQYSLSGKLFSALPVKTPWGEVSTVFDEMLALSSAWVEKVPAGLVVGSGDVLLTFDVGALDWSRPGVCGVAMRQPIEVGMRHGVYVTDERGRVYAFLQKPSAAEAKAAGGILEDGQVALDIGLLRFAPESAAKLSELAGLRERDGNLELGPGVFDEDAARERELPTIDLYEHITKALTGQWTPGSQDSPALQTLAAALKGLPFWCSVVSGDFTHVGTTTLFRRLMTEETEFSNLYAVQQRLGVSRQPGLRSAGVVIDSVLTGGGELGAGAVAIECNLGCRVRAGRGAVLHGLEGIPAEVNVPEDTVVHQVPVVLPDGHRGTVIRAYGVEDDPKASVAAWKATWFGRPMLEELRTLGIDLSKVWPGLPSDQWTLWNAELFPVTSVEEAWACAQWLMRVSNGFSAARWAELRCLSLATSAHWADPSVLEAAHSRRLKANWRTLAVSLAAAGADLRPLLAHAPGVAPLAETGHLLQSQAAAQEQSAPTESARYYFAASLFFGQAGLAAEAGSSRESAFRMVQQAVQAGSINAEMPAGPCWRHDEVIVQGPARIDLGGGWSDTPPFCLDWGGTVLNVALELNGTYPIHTAIRRIAEPVIRCDAGAEAGVATYRETAEILGPARPGDPFSIPRTALYMSGLFREAEPLNVTLERLGGGLEIQTAVHLPMGSGLGTSSILAATMLRGISEMLGASPDDQELSDQVMRLEQLMTTGGGWQDQAGGIFPGAKLLLSGPGLQQRVRVEPLACTEARISEFQNLMVLYYTGIRRIARNLLQQVVGNYLARETGTVQVLHSIKTLAVEMAYAIQEGEWDRLGQLLDRHWALNQIMDPNTTNAPINALLDDVRPFIRGVKLAGAGGGGFLLLLARSPEKAAELRRFLETREAGNGGAVFDWRIAGDGLRVQRR
jgi:fucokinase